MDIWAALDNFDKLAFTFVHAEASAPWLDGFMKLLRNAITWIPLYVFMLYWIIRYAKPHAWQFILLTLLCFAVTDFLSASVFKPLFGRIRPCFDPELQPILRKLVNCGGQLSLPSSHASNHFGMATFWFLCVYKISNKKWYLLWLWAFAICYAQVYVGKHYPLDVLAGAVLGILVGILFSYIFNRWQFPASSKQVYKPLPGFN